MMGSDYLLLTQELAGVPRSMPGTPVLSATDKRQDLLDAVDFLVTGI